MFLADLDGDDPLSRGEDLERVVLTGIQLFFHVEDATILPLLVLVNSQVIVTQAHEVDSY